MKYIELASDFLTSSRMKSLYWRSFAMLASGTMDVLLQALTDWNPDAILTVFAGLVFAEITKQLNKKKQ